MTRRLFDCRRSSVTAKRGKQPRWRSIIRGEERVSLVLEGAPRAARALDGVRPWGYCACAEAKRLRVNSGTSRNVSNRSGESNGCFRREMAATIVQKHTDRNLGAHRSDNKVQCSIPGHIPGRYEQAARRACQAQVLTAALAQLNLNRILRSGGIQPIELQRGQIRVTIAREVRHGEAQWKGARRGRTVARQRRRGYCTPKNRNRGASDRRGASALLDKNRASL